MKKQKKGFINFVCSLIPGAGPMNMGLEKQGLSIMIAFWGIAAIAVLLRMEFLVIVLPVIWLYSFFHTHNLKNMAEEQFAKEEDRYLFNLNYIMANREELFEKYHVLIAVLLILGGASIVGRGIISAVWNIVPFYMYDAVSTLIHLVGAGVVGIGVVIAGIIMIRKKNDYQENQEG